MNKEIIQEITNFRRELHQHPELPGMEYETARRIIAFLKRYSPDKIYDKLGGEGVLARYDLPFSAFSEPQSYYSLIISECIDHTLRKNSEISPISVLFRCELDALPTKKGAAHLCGHDGHMALMCGFAAELSALRDSSHNDSPEKMVSVYLFYQPAEETGEGAKRVAKELSEMGMAFNYSFAFHNKPGNELGKILIPEGTYAFASVGVEVLLRGLASHASEPEKGISPIKAISDIIKYSSHTINSSLYDNLATIVYIDMGEKAYGTSPGTASVGLTIRAINDEDLALFRSETESFLQLIAQKRGLELEIIYHDHFPATINNDITNEIAYKAAMRKGLKVLKSANMASRGSDDFAHLTLNTKASFIDIGSGYKQPPLHDINYDFPDELIGIIL